MTETTTTTQASKPTIKQQFSQEVHVPLWLCLCFIAAATSAGMGAGRLPSMHDPASFYFGAAAVFYFLPFVAMVPRAVRKAKAKRAAQPAAPFVKDGAAVSPVIGVILMVAITVVLAAIVFVLVSHLAHSSGVAPTMAFNEDSKGHTLTVVSADAGADWSQVHASLSGSAAGCAYKLNNGAATSANAALTTAANTPITAGDTLTVSSTGPGTCTLKLSYMSVNQLLGDWTWSF